MRRTSNKNANVVLGLVLGGLATVGTCGLSVASDTPQPTFLESGDNDLVRFQMGGVPTQETMAKFLEAPQSVSEPLPVARKNTVSVSRSKSLQRVTKQLAADSSARQEARTREQASSGRIMPQDAVTAPASTKPAPAPLSKPDANEQDARAVEKTQGVGLYTGGAPQASSLAADTAMESETLEAAPSQPAPALETPSPRPGFSEEISSRLVAVCLNNPEDASGPKAFDIRRNGPPRYVADIGATTCARFEPTRHTLYLWKTNDIGVLSLILSNRLDLNDADGTQVTLDWIRDR